jgi:hypothetical protein
MKITRGDTFWLGILVGIVLASLISFFAYLIMKFGMAVAVIGLFVFLFAKFVDHLLHKSKNAG